MRQALFLDRDGVINHDSGYVYRKEDFVFIQGIFEVVELANRLGYLVIVVTNQAGIGRGYYSTQQFSELMEWVRKSFEPHGGLAEVYFCADHPVFGLGQYKRESEDRKPNPGMILRAAREFDLDLNRSFLVGDKQTDIQAGYKAGIRNLFLFDSVDQADNCTRISELVEVKPFLLSQSAPSGSTNFEPIN